MIPESVLRWAYAELSAIAENSPELAFESDVDRYHEILDRVDALGYDTSTLRFDKDRDLFANPRNPANRQILSSLYANRIRATARLFQLEVTDTKIGFGAPRRDG